MTARTKRPVDGVAGNTTDDLVTRKATATPPRHIRHSSMSPVAQRAHDLHNTWLRRTKRDGRTASADDIKAAFFAAIMIAKHEDRTRKRGPK